MKRKIGSIAVAVIMAAALLAGCGNKSTGAANETDTTASEKTDGLKEEKKEDETKKAEQKTESSEEAKEMTVTDMAGRVVTIPAGAEKFAAIGPGCLRLYCYVADTSALVGAEQIEIDDATGRSYVMADKDIQKLSSIGAGGPTNAPDPEKLLTADPDVIFTCYNSDVAAIDDLQEKTGIPVVCLLYTSCDFYPYCKRPGEKCRSIRPELPGKVDEHCAACHFPEN